MLKRFLSRIFPNWFPPPKSFSLRPVYDDKGNVVGLADEMTHNFLNSKAPDPTQEDLDKILDATDRLRFITLKSRSLVKDVPTEIIIAFANGEELDSKYVTITEEKVHLEVQGESLEEAKEYLKIENSGGHLMCCSGKCLEFYQDTDKLAQIEILAEGSTLRWEKWRCDAIFLDDRFIKWLGRQGISLYM